VAEYDSVIPAGKSGTLKAKVHTTQGRSQRLSKTVAVTTDFPQMRQMTLRLTLESVAAITITPRPSLMVMATVGSDASERLLLHRGDGQPLLVDKIEVNPPDIFTVSLIPAEGKNKEYGRLVGQPGDLWLTASVLPQQNVGSKNANAVLHTNHPDQPKLTVPLTARVRELIEVMPTTAQIRLRDGKALGRYTSATLRSNTRQAFEVTSIEVAHPEVYTATCLTKGARTSHTIRIQLAAELDESTLNLPYHGKVKIGTSEPGKPALELGLLIAEHRYQSRRPSTARVRPPQARRRPTPQATTPDPEPTPGTN
jgi:hypothetical protein